MSNKSWVILRVVREQWELCAYVAGGLFQPSQITTNCWFWQISSRIMALRHNSQIKLMFMNFFIFNPYFLIMRPPKASASSQRHRNLRLIICTVDYELLKKSLWSFSNLWGSQWSTSNLCSPWEQNYPKLQSKARDHNDLAKHSFHW